MNKPLLFSVIGSFITSIIFFILYNKYERYARGVMHEFSESYNGADFADKEAALINSFEIIAIVFFVATVILMLIACLVYIFKKDEKQATL